jgi:hypothetical protein
MAKPKRIAMGTHNPVMTRNAVLCDAVPMRTWGILEEGQKPGLRVRSKACLSNEDWSGWEIEYDEWMEPNTVEIVGNSDPVIVYRLGMPYRDAEELSSDGRELSRRYYEEYVAW